MKIGEAARETGVTIKAIRHYEAVGLLDPIPRQGRYRVLGPAHLQRLRLIAHCRELGFGLADIADIVRLVDDAGSDCPDPDAMLSLVDGRLATVRERIRRLEGLEAQLTSTRRYLDTRRA